MKLLNLEKVFGQFLTDSMKETNDLQKDAEKMDIAMAAEKSTTYQRWSLRPKKRRSH